MQDIAIFLPKRAVADEGREAEVEELGKGARFGVNAVGGSYAVETADEGGELRVEDSLEVGIFLVGSDYVGGGGERVIEGWGGSWRFTGARGGRMGGVHVHSQATAFRAGGESRRMQLQSGPTCTTEVTRAEARATGMSDY